MFRKVYVLASHKPWGIALFKRLALRPRENWNLISEPALLTYAELEAIQPRYVFLPHWSHRIPAEVWQNYECIVFHMTDLPFGRGGSPLQNLIVRGFEDTVISALRCEAGLDAGPIYLKRPLSLHGNAEEIFMRAVVIIESMIAEIIDRQPEPVPQEGDPVVFRRRRPEDGNIVGLAALPQVYDYIRMLDADGYPRAFIDVGNLRIEFSRASFRVGEIIADARITLRPGLVPAEQTKEET